MKSLAQILYEAYCEHAGWKSVVTGTDLPQWSDLKPEIKDAWEAASCAAYTNTPSNAGTFGWAVTMLQDGHRVSRGGWNGKGMWLTYSPGQADLPAERFFSPHTREFAEKSGGKATVSPSIMIKNANETISYWQPSSGDMFANDWNIAA